MQRCSNGPLLEVLMRNTLLCAKFDESKIEASITSDLQVNYNNIHKVLTVIRIMTLNLFSFTFSNGSSFIV